MTIELKGFLSALAPQHPARDLLPAMLGIAIVPVLRRFDRHLPDVLVGDLFRDLADSLAESLAQVMPGEIDRLAEMQNPAIHRTITSV
jgi:hypothetical protein